MSGEELKKKLKDAGISQAEVARRLGVVPQSVIQTLEAKDIKSGFIEELCRVLDKDITFFYGGISPQVNDELEKAKDTIKHLYETVEQLQEENSRLKSDIIRLNDPDLPKKESEVYRLWMEHMKLSEQQMVLSDRMRELYQKQKEG